jgi:hypothetical protein
MDPFSAHFEEYGSWNSIRPKRCSSLSLCVVNKESDRSDIKIESDFTHMTEVPRESGESKLLPKHSNSGFLIGGRSGRTVISTIGVWPDGYQRRGSG